MAMGVFAQQTATATQPPKPAAATAQAPAPAAAKSAPATTAPAQAKPAAVPAKEAPKAAPVAKADTAKASPAAKPAPAAKPDSTKAAPVAKQDTTKAAPKADSAKVAPAAKQDSTKAAPKADSAKVAPAAKQDSTKAAPKVDSAKVAPAAKPDSTKAAPKADSAKVAPAAKPDSTKAAPKADSAKVAPAAKQDSTKADSTKADSAKVAPAAKQDSTKADSTKADSAKVAPAKTDTVYVYKDTTKVKPRGKKFFKDHQDSVMAEKAERDSLTTHHGISIMGGRNHDHRYGYIDEDNNWGFGAGLYYFYRHYFGSHFALEGRFGGIYRYSRWTEDFDFPQSHNIARLGDGKYDLNHHFDLYYDNYAVDAPLSAKVGGHVGATEFLYAGVTLGLTKTFYEKVTSRNELTLKDVPEDLAKDLEILDKEGKNPFPMKEDRYTSHWFQMCDWETNAWINVGLDSKFVSLEAQVLIISAATTTYSHRFEYLGHDLRPTWRLFMDFSIR